MATLTMKRTRSLRPDEIAAYNHGFCYCMTYAARRSINYEDRDAQACDFYPDETRRGESRRRMFCAGYDVALDEINTGRLTAVTLGPNANAPSKDDAPC